MDSPNRLTIPWPTEQGPLTFDCLVAICKFLQPEDLVRFSLACRVCTKYLYNYIVSIFIPSGILSCFLYWQFVEVRYVYEIVSRSQTSFFF